MQLCEEVLAFVLLYFDIEDGVEVNDHARKCTSIIVLHDCIIFMLLPQA